MATGRTPAENSQNVCFYSPYGPRSLYVKAPLASKKMLSFNDYTTSILKSERCRPLIPVADLGGCLIACRPLNFFKSKLKGKRERATEAKENK